MPENIKVQFIKLLQMQKYNIADFIGEYQRNSTSPNTYKCQDLDRTLIVRCRPNPLPHQTKYYLVGKEGKGKSFYISALWTHTATQNTKLNQYVITDTQSVRGIVELDMFCLKLKKA